MSTWNRMVRISIVAITAGAMAAVVGCSKQDEAPAKAAAVGPSADKTAAAVPVVPAEPARDPATVLVKVADTTLTVGEVEQQLAPVMAQMGSDPRLPAMKDRFYQQVVDRFVIRTVLAAEADRRKIEVTPADMTEAVAMITNRMPSGMTLEDALSRDGMTLDQFRSNLTVELRIKSLVESAVPTNMAVSDQEVAEFYAQEKERFATPEGVTARHILLKVEEGADDKVRAEKKAKAEALQKQLAGGADFAALARENSDCPSKERGGDLGQFGRGQMVKAFEDAAFTQATNAIGPVVQTEFGYHIIQVTGRQKAGAMSLEEVKPRLSEHLRQKKQMVAFETLLNGLKSKVSITYDDSVKPQPRPVGMPAGMPAGDGQ